MRKEMVYKRDNVEIKRFDGSDKKENMELAKSYMRSYNTLSEKYKSPEEMECYTLGFFMNKLDKIAKDESSDTFVLMVDNQAKGFVRYSPVPEYYKHANEEGIAVDRETGSMAGVDYDFERKIKFAGDVRLDDNSVCVNQIYLDPSIQSHGLGTTLLRNTLPLVEEKGYDNVIIEYNTQNERAKRFYAYSMGLSKLAETQDFDNIVIKDGRPVECISSVEIGHNTIDGALSKLRKIENSRFGANDNEMLQQYTKAAGRNFNS